MKRLVVFGIAVAALVFAAAALALDPAPKCQAGKNKDAGQYAACLQKAEMKPVKTKGTCSVTTRLDCYRDDDCPVSETCDKDLTKYDEAVTKCNEKFFDKWAKDEEKAGAGVCPDGIADPNTMADFITEHSDAVATALAGGGLPTCGDGVLDPNEDCDLGTLGGADCDSATSGAQPVGTLGCSANCTFDTSGCMVRFVDNGNGTITDNQTKLMWEKKSYDGTIHSFTVAYTWRVTGAPYYPPDGTAFTVFLATLNTNPCFAGYCDWRLPSLAELQTIWYGAASGPPYTYDAFRTGCTSGCTVLSCSCAGGQHWTATTVDTGAGYAWAAIFNLIWNPAGLDKGSTVMVRAVRGGL
jgi:hypothetical protein